MKIETILNNIAALSKAQAGIQSSMIDSIIDLVPKTRQEAARKVVNDLQAQINELEVEIKSLKDQASIQILNLEHTVKVDGCTATYNKGKVTWDAITLEEIAKKSPKVAACKKEGRPYVSFRVA